MTCCSLDTQCDSLHDAEVAHQRWQQELREEQGHREVQGQFPHAGILCMFLCESWKYAVKSKQHWKGTAGISGIAATDCVFLQSAMLCSKQYGIPSSPVHYLTLQRRRLFVACIALLPISCHCPAPVIMLDSFQKKKKEKKKKRRKRRKGKREGIAKGLGLQTSKCSTTIGMDLIIT